MADNPEAFLATPDRLEAAFESAKVVNGANPTGDILNTFMAEELMNMGRHLLEHMRDEARWGGSNEVFEPVDFAVAASEVAHDQAAGRSDATNIYVQERQPVKLTHDIFISFWLPRIAKVAYGEEYAGSVRSILQDLNT